MDYNALECGVCNNGYSEVYCPRILPCSHTLCGPCIDGVISSRKKECPFCRKVFAANSAKDMMFIRSLLDAANQFSAMALESETSRRTKTAPVKNSSKDFRKKFPKKGVTNCLEAPSQVIDAIDGLSEMKNHILCSNNDIDKLSQLLPQLKSFNETIIGSIERNKKMLENKLDVMLDLTQHGTRACPRAMEELRAIQESLQKNNWGEVDLPESYVEMKTMLGNVAEEIRKTIKEAPVYISVNELRSLCFTPGEIQRKIFAVKVTKGIKRVAPIKIMSENIAYVDHMKEGEIPLNSFVVEMKSLMRLTPRRAYLDLGLCGVNHGRIVIEVKDEGNKAKNFLHMCAGDLGPSYVDTPLLSTERRGRNGECITAGVYEDCGDMISDAVMQGVNWEREIERDIYQPTSVVAGNVRGPISFDGAAEFDIYTRGSPTWRDANHFGDVLEGLNVVENVIRDYPDARHVDIIDCGIIITF